jgi:hypothetical protein
VAEVCPEVEHLLALAVSGQQSGFVQHLQVSRDPARRQVQPGRQLAGRLGRVEDHQQYQGAFRLGNQLQSMLGPAAFTALAVTWNPIGWLLIAVLIVLAALALGPAAQASARLRSAEVSEVGRGGPGVRSGS